MKKKLSERKRREPFDQRKLPHIRAPLEAARNHGLTGKLYTVFLVFWDCQGDWDKVEEWFKQPKVQDKYWQECKGTMIGNASLLEPAYDEAVELYRKYSTPAATVH